MRRVLAVAIVAIVPLFVACGGGDSSTSGGGEVRTVLVDYQHDEFASAFLRYYPEIVKVRQGDTVRFKQTWTGEPHSVTMGTLVDDLFAHQDLFQYDSPDDARAAGKSEAEIEEAVQALAKIPNMTGQSRDLYQPGAQPCFVESVADVPSFNDPINETQDDNAECPTKGDPQPPFDGRQALYNSGFIPYEGEGGNTYEVPIANDAQPGTYRYFCNYHFLNMSGSITIVPAAQDVPSQAVVARQARKEIDEDATVALKKAEEAKKGKVGDLDVPLAGREADEDFAVIINEFFPRNPKAKVGQKVTWTFDGATHTVSFNVPKYFPVFTVAKDGTVTWNPNAHEAVGFDIPDPPRSEDEHGEAPGREVDAGKWDGSGGFHSSGALNPGDKFTITFTKPGSYPYACVLHPQMVGTLKVEA